MGHFSSKFGCSGLSCSQVSSPDYYCHIYPENMAVCSAETHQRDGCLQNNISWPEPGHWWVGQETNKGTAGKWFSCYLHVETYRGSRSLEDNAFPPFMHHNWLGCAVGESGSISSGHGSRFYISLFFLSLFMFNLTFYPQGKLNKHNLLITFPSFTLQKGFLQESIAVSLHQ